MLRGKKAPMSFLLTILVAIGFLLINVRTAAGASWTHTWGGPSSDYANAVTRDTGGNVYVAGSTSSFDAGAQHVLILKYSATGTLLWAKTWGGSGDEYAASIAFGPDGFLYVTGRTSSFGAGWYDMFLLKLDSDGNLGTPGTWAETWGGGSYDMGHDLGFDNLGNIYLVGETYSYGPCCSSAILMKFSPSGGKPLWTASWKDTATYDGGYSLAVDSTGNVIITGISWDYTVYPNHNYLLLVKFDASGNYLWSENWFTPIPGQDGSWAFRDVTTDNAGNIYVGGYHSAQCQNPDFTQCTSDAMVLKLDSGGNFQWADTWGGPGSSQAGSIGIDPSGHLLVSGIENQYGQSPTPFLLTYDTGGSLLSATGWLAQQPLSPWQIGGMILDNIGNVYFAGEAQNNSGLWAPISEPTGVLPNLLAYNAYTLGAPVGQQVSLTNQTQLQTGGVPDMGGGGADAFIAVLPLSSTSQWTNLGPVPTQAYNSEPVGTGNGNYFYQHTDFAIPGRGMPLVFQRSYNALDNYSGPLGANWTHSYNVFLVQTSAGAVIKWGDGHGETYTLSGGAYLPQPGVFNTLIQNADGTYVLTQKNQSRYLFSATGSLTSIVDKNGNTIALTHNGGNLTQITDTVGRNLLLSYDASNRIIQITDPIGRTVTFAYSASDDLVAVTDPVGGLTQLAYDGSHHVAAITLPNSQILLQNTYDAAGRVLTQTNGRGFTTTFAYNTPSPGQTTITDARGQSTVHTYDASLRITTITDALGGVVSYTYDANNDRTSVTNQNGKATSFSYDGTGNLTNIADALADYSVFMYDAKNDLLTATNPKSATTTFFYDVNGNLLTIQDTLAHNTTFAYDGYGQLKSKTDANGNLTVYGYDAFGNLAQITDALGHVTTLAYDGLGRLTSITDPNGHTASASYDALSRLTKVSDPLGNQTQFAYDAVGNLQKITDANGHAAIYGYDAVNNLVTVTDALGHVTQYAYDANNNRTTFTNAKGNATLYAFDNLNRLSSVTDPLSFATTYAYDPVGNVTAVKDANGKTNQFACDALNRLIGISYADGKTVTYSYDADGNRTTMVDVHGTTGYVYDALDRLTSVTSPGSKTVSYGYDAVGNRNSLTYPDGKMANYTYDAVNRLSGVTDWLTRTTSYSYDFASNLTRIAYPNQAAMTFAYDAANRLTAVVNAMRGVPPVAIAYTLDPVGNRTKLNVAGIATDFGYDGVNELMSARLGPLMSTWAYDAVGNRLKQTSPLGTTTYGYDAGDRLVTAGLTTFTYDNNGNQITKTSGKLTWTYTYDAANRLGKALGYGMNSTFGYDGDGNRTAQTNGTGTYSYLNDVATALPVVLNEQGPDGNITYAYGLGLIEEYSSAFNNFYHYDGLGSVIGLTNAKGALQAAYVYDPWGNALLSATDFVGTKNKFRFTDQALDPGTGLYYLRARYYDSVVGRFITRDPMGGHILCPATLNRFSYALNRPTNLVDPRGLAPESSTGMNNPNAGSALLEAVGGQGASQAGSIMTFSSNSESTAPFAFPPLGIPKLPSVSTPTLPSGWEPAAYQPGSNSASTPAVALTPSDSGFVDALNAITSPSTALEMTTVISSDPLLGGPLGGVLYLGVSAIVQLNFWLYNQSMFEHPPGN